MKPLSFCQLTEKGHRKVNEDFSAYKITDNWSLFVVADGLGAHAGGAKLAQNFCQKFVDLLEKFMSEMESKALAEKSMLNWYNLTLENLKNDPSLKEAHTTFAAVYLSNTKMVSLHIGDTRIYRLSQGNILKTEDHSVPQVLFDEGIINENEIATHKYQNLLTKSINFNEEHTPTIIQQAPLEHSESLVLCSDGFWVLTTEAELRQMEGVTPDEKILRKQIKTILKRSKRQSDNITVQWICNMNPINNSV